MRGPRRRQSGDLRDGRRIRFPAQHGLLGAAQLRPRVQAEFVAQRFAGVGEGGERAGRVAVVVQGEHQAAAQPFAQGMPAHGPAQGVDHGRPGTAREFHVRLCLDRAQVPLGEVRRDALQGGSFDDVLQWRPVPECQGAAQCAGGPRKVVPGHRLPCPLDEGLEAGDVGLAVVRPERVAGAGCDQPGVGAVRGGRQEPAQLHHIRAQIGHGRPGRGAAPEYFHEGGHGDDAAPVGDQHRENGALFVSGYTDGLATVHDFQRAEGPELDGHACDCPPVCDSYKALPPSRRTATPMIRSASKNPR